MRLKANIFVSRKVKMWKVKKENKKEAKKKPKKQNENLIVGQIHTIKAFFFCSFTEPPGVYILIPVPFNIMKQKFIR